MEGMDGGGRRAVHCRGSAIGVQRVIFGGSADKGGAGLPSGQRLVPGNKHVGDISVCSCVLLDTAPKDAIREMTPREEGAGKRQTLQDAWGSLGGSKSLA